MEKISEASWRIGLGIVERRERDAVAVGAKPGGDELENRRVVREMPAR